jgi:uncharacterized protein (TIGR02145 family)
MAIELTSTNFNGQDALVTLYLPTGTTIPYSAATSVNIGLQNIPFTYQAPYIAWEYGQFVLDFTGSSKVCLSRQVTPPDGDGNVYDIIEIGSQVWMAENLKTTKYQNGVSIPKLTSTAQWSATTIASCCSVNFDSVYDELFGLFYNLLSLSASTSGVTTYNLCPTGYHIPNKTEWETLQATVGSGTGTNKLKYPGLTYWNFPSDLDSTNSAGFTALGAGYQANTIYAGYAQRGVFWGISGFLPIMSVVNYSGGFNFEALGNNTTLGYSVRCLKD